MNDLNDRIERLRVRHLRSWYAPFSLIVLFVMTGIIGYAVMGAAVNAAERLPETDVPQLVLVGGLLALFVTMTCVLVLGISMLLPGGQEEHRLLILALYERLEELEPSGDGKEIQQ